jgi:hypothetical protein
MLRRIFGPRRENISVSRKLHNEGLHNLYSPLNIIRVIKSKKKSWVGYVAPWERCINKFGQTI